MARNARQQEFVRRLVEQEDDPSVRASLESMESLLESDPEAIRQREDVAILVHAALDYLPQRYAQVLELKYLEDLSVETIAVRLGVTAITVQSLLARARTAFRDATAALAPGFERLTLAPPARHGSRGPR